MVATMKEGTSTDPGPEVIRFLTIRDIADRLQVAPRTVQLWIVTEGLPALKVGNILRVDPTDLQAFIETHKSGKTG